MPPHSGNGANSATSQEGEQATGSIEEADRVGQDHLRGIALLVTTLIADGGPIPHTAASIRRKVAGRLRLPTAVSSTSCLSPRSGRRERHHHLCCTMLLANTGETFILTAAPYSLYNSLDPPSTIGFT